MSCLGGDDSHAQHHHVSFRLLTAPVAESAEYADAYRFMPVLLEGAWKRGALCSVCFIPRKGSRIYSTYRLINANVLVCRRRSE
jgi:hypothetical protein